MMWKESPVSELCSSQKFVFKRIKRLMMERLGKAAVAEVITGRTLNLYTLVNIGAVVLHAGTNDIRLRQTEILKKDFRSLVELVRTTSPTTRIIVSGPLPTFQRGIE
ncbi:hypothetical protein QTP86_019510, partial [Hemibagrus guttatus]